MPGGRVAVAVTSMVVAGWLSAACSSSSHPSQVSGGPDASGNAGGRVTAGGASGLRTGNSSGAGGSNGGLTDACAANVSTAEPFPLDMYLMLDTSSSMLDPTAANVSKWDAVKRALEAFIKDQASAGLGVGLQYFPLDKPSAPASCASNPECGDSGPCILKICYGVDAIYPCQAEPDCVDANGKDHGPCVQLAQCSKNADYVCPNAGAKCKATDTTLDLGTCTPIARSICAHTASCDATAYAAPSAAVAALPGAAATLLASIDAQLPSGNTPTAPALSGALQQASTWASAHPQHRVVAVLATDGLPTECTPTAIESVAGIAAAGVAATPSISTFVIGVFAPADITQGAENNLNAIAARGGTTKAFMVDTAADVTTQFLAALDSIRGARLACEFQIPQAGVDQTLDFGRVNVELTNQDRTDVVYYVGSASACEATTGGWYYDVDPAAGMPAKIIACPASCSAFQTAEVGASVGIAVGCATVVQ